MTNPVSVVLEACEDSITLTLPLIRLPFPSGSGAKSRSTDVVLSAPEDRPVSVMLDGLEMLSIPPGGAATLRAVKREGERTTIEWFKLPKGGG